jgi:hypothetical protein
MQASLSLVSQMHSTVFGLLITMSNVNYHWCFVGQLQLHEIDELTLVHR